MAKECFIQVVSRPKSRPFMHPAIRRCRTFENYAKLYFHTKDLEKVLNRGEEGGGRGEIFAALFFKKVPFLDNIGGRCPNFLD